MRVLILSCSMNPHSRSARLAECAAEALSAHPVETELIDLRECELPVCDGRGAQHHPMAQRLSEAVASADAVIVALAVYNYGANAAAKNAIELTGKAWQHKLVGFLCAAGGPSSYMSVMSLANSLMLDFRCLVVPRFVYATKQAFDAAGTPGEPVPERIAELCAEIVRVGQALKYAPLTAETNAHDAAAGTSGGRGRDRAAGGG